MTRLAPWICGVLVFFSLFILGLFWGNRLISGQGAESAALHGLERRAGELAVAVTEQTRGALFNVDLAMLHLSQVNRAAGRLTEADVETIKDATPSGLVRRITVIDRNGKAVATYPAGGAGLELGDRPHFLAHARDGAPGLFIGRPIRSRVDNEWVIPLSRRLADHRGNFAGVIAVMVRPDYLSSIYGRLASGHDDVIALVHQDGAFLSRSQNLDNHLGKSVNPDRPFVGAQAPESGSFRSVSSYEPVDRVFAFRRLSEWPLVAVVGLGFGEALEPLRATARQEFRWALAVSALVVVLVAGICVAILQLERSLVRARVSAARRAMAAAGASELGWEWDVAAGRLFFFGNGKAFFGGDSGERELSVDEWHGLIDPEQAHSFREQLRAFVNNGPGILECRFRIRMANGEFRWVLVRGKAVRVGNDGKVQRAFGILTDIDAERMAQLAAQQTQEAFQRIIDSSAEGIVEVDRNGMIRLLNPAVERLLGWGEQEVEGRPIHRVFHCPPGSENSPDEECPVMQTLADGQTRQARRLTYFHRDGHRVPVEVSVAPNTLSGRIDGAVALISDISQQLAYETNLERLARTDGLTGLWNRRYFVELFGHELKRAERSRLPLSLLMIDIDYFKRVNDQYGHAAGDAVLIAYAGRFRSVLREVDIIGRLGGEEFGVGLPGIDIDEAMVAAERLRVAFEALEVTVSGQTIHCTISLGVAQWASGESFDTIFGRADAALYRAKAEGRNRVCR